MCVADCVGLPCTFMKARSRPATVSSRCQPVRCGSPAKKARVACASRPLTRQQVFLGTDTGRMKEMALVAALAAFASLASALANEEAAGPPQTLEVKCSLQGEVTPKGGVEITVNDTTLTLTCPDNYKAEPAPTGSVPDKEQMVCKTDNCKTKVALKEYCSGATGQIVTKSSVLKLSLPTVPSGLPSFYLQCTPALGQRTNQACTVPVRVKSPTKPGGHDTSTGEGTQQQGTGPAAGPAGVQTCLRKNRTITVRLPEKGSSAQFACESGSTLYPVEPDKVFSKDCKKQETLKDMTRSQTTGATPVRGGTAEPTYTLKADKKPAKKTLCYLCATTGTSAEDRGTAEDYCTIYVESGAGTQFGFSFIVALALPCVSAVLQFT